MPFHLKVLKLITEFQPERLQSWVSQQGKALQQFHSYLSYKSVSVVSGDASPRAIICCHNLTFHCYADDTQLFIQVKSSSSSSACLKACLSDFQSWMWKSLASRCFWQASLPVTIFQQSYSRPLKKQCREWLVLLYVHVRNDWLTIVIASTQRSDSQTDVSVFIMSIPSILFLLTLFMLSAKQMNFYLIVQTKVWRKSSDLITFLGCQKRNLTLDIS